MVCGIFFLNFAWLKTILFANSITILFVIAMAEDFITLILLAGTFIFRTSESGLSLVVEVLTVFNVILMDFKRFIPETVAKAKKRGKILL